MKAFDRTEVSKRMYFEKKVWRKGKKSSGQKQIDLKRPSSIEICPRPVVVLFQDKKSSFWKEK